MILSVNKMKLYNLALKKLNKINPKDIIIAVYGLGKMGLPLAATFANKGFKVISVDANKKIVADVNNGKNYIPKEIGLSALLKKVVKNNSLRATTDGIYAARNSDIKVIIIPIYLDSKNNPDLTSLKDVLGKIARGLTKGDIVILESTVPPGTTLNIVGKMLEHFSGLKLNKDFGVAFCPERISSGTAIADMGGRLCPKIVGGSDSKTTRIAEFLYSKINKRAVIPVQNPTVAELIKVSEESYRDVNIAFANNLYLICRELGVDAFELIKACNTNPYCRILTPGPGVGGHCIPVYPYFIFNKTKGNHDLLKLARQINDSMTQHVISLTKDALKEKNLKLSGANILILGIAYRAGVKEIRKSPGIKIAQELMGKAKCVYVYDPLFSEIEIKNLGLQYKKDFSDSDCIIITTDETYFKKMNWKKVGSQLRSKIIIDTKNIINYETLSHLGFTIRRIGYAK